MLDAGKVKDFTLLPFSMGSQHFMMEAQWVLEILGQVQAIEVPGADYCVSQAFLWKKQAVPLIRLQACLPLEALGEGLERTLVLELPEGVVAMRVDSVGAIVSTSRDALVESGTNGLPFLPVQVPFDGASARLLDLPSLVHHLVTRINASN